MLITDRHTNRGFTLIELLVVIAIIGVLASVVLASLNSARVKARDSKRIQDLIQLRTIVDEYYADHGSYPLPYPNVWGGVTTDPCGTNAGTSGANAYIQGVVPDYISVLPTDPLNSGSCAGYLYNSDGTNYKILIHNSWEGAYPSANQPFYDPNRPTWALMVCSGEPACSGW